MYNIQFEKLDITKRAKLCIKTINTLCIKFLCPIKIINLNLVANRHNCLLAAVFL